ncbi:hypothetical protein GCM10020367_17740 [Streptomyces sannanensis]|uniref:Uncharacterized protein n=1 Tax=Streptomyces sannanensis TaxID=285536 RepID=A0ABP6S8V8_9ACTN
MCGASVVCGAAVGASAAAVGYYTTYHGDDMYSEPTFWAMTASGGIGAGVAAKLTGRAAEGGARAVTSAAVDDAAVRLELQLGKTEMALAKLRAELAKLD